MIVTVDDIRVLRDIGRNVDPSMLIPYCEEAEKQDVMPVITPHLYKEIEANPLSPKYKLLLDGGYYGESPNECYFRGLKIAIGYIAYSRALLTGDVKLTNFGAVRKFGTNSEAIDEATKIRASNEARKLGDDCLRACKQYIDQYLCCPGRGKFDSITSRKFIKIKKRSV